MKNPRAERHTGSYRVLSALEAALLSVHILDDYVVNLAERGAVFEHLPRLVCVEMNLYKLIVADGKHQELIQSCQVYKNLYETQLMSPQ